MCYLIMKNEDLYVLESCTRSSGTAIKDSPVYVCRFKVPDTPVEYTVTTRKFPNPTRRYTLEDIKNIKF